MHGLLSFLELWHNLHPCHLIRLGPKIWWPSQYASSLKISSPEENKNKSRLGPVNASSEACSAAGPNGYYSFVLLLESTITCWQLDAIIYVRARSIKAG
jgi:hypothetical protein